MPRGVIRCHLPVCLSRSGGACCLNSSACLLVNLWVSRYILRFALRGKRFRHRGRRGVRRNRLSGIL
jgi:hypothetical protein